MSQAKPKKRQIAANWSDIEIENSKCAGELHSEGLSAALIEIALSPASLPRMESDGKTTLILLRIFDDAADRRAAGPRELTRKLGVYLQDHSVTTVHRFKTPDYPGFLESTAADRDSILGMLLERTIGTYVDALNASEDQFEALEVSVFQPVKSKTFRLRDAYFEKRRLNVIRKMLRLHLELMDSLSAVPDSEKLVITLRKGPKKKAVQALSNCEALLESMNHLLALQLSLVSQKTNEASQRTNEVMRVLTVFSAFFLPLSFIAGVYGMNFEGMPELKHRYGYPAAILLMIIVAAVIYVWFRKRGWIGKSGI